MWAYHASLRAIYFYQRRHPRESFNEDPDATQEGQDIDFTADFRGTDGEASGKDRWESDIVEDKEWSVIGVEDWDRDESREWSWAKVVWEWTRQSHTQAREGIARAWIAGDSLTSFVCGAELRTDRYDPQQPAATWGIQRPLAVDDTVAGPGETREWTDMEIASGWSQGDDWGSM